MDIFTMNAVCITVVAVAALWVFYRSAHSERKRSSRDEEEK